MRTSATAFWTWLRVIGVAGLVLGLARPASAQAIDGFNPGANGYVFAVAIQRDGKILIGGEFSDLGCQGGVCGPGSIERNYIARLNADGTVDASFNPGANGPVRAIIVLPDDRIVIGGQFQMVGGGGTGNQNIRYLAKLNPDGSVDATFNPGINMNNYVDAMALQPDGRILVGGGFYGGLGGQARYYFGRLNADGTADQTFETWTNGPVYTIALQPDGKILIGGLFTSIGGEQPDVTRNRIGRVNADGTIDMTFNPGANQRVDAIAVQADGKILVGGFFTGLGGGTGTTPRFHIGRLEADGIVDQDFIPGNDGLVYSFAVQADGRIIVAGSFSTLGGGGTGVTARENVGRLNIDGSIDPTFNPGANGDVHALAVQIDGHVVMGGRFTHIGDGNGPGAVDRRYIGRVLNTDPALQSVTVTDGGATITWLRNGTMPEVAFTDFAMSTDGVTYTPLGSPSGAGTRLVGGWRVSGVSLPVNPNLTLRMRAYYAGGQYNASSSMIEWIVPAADFNVIENGDFSLGLSGWLFFATPDMTYIVNNVTAGVLNFYRVPPPPGTTNQAVAYQQTGVPLGANVPLVAEFDLGNSSTVRKRVAILLHDSDFSDIAVCTFWLPANMPLTRYRIDTHTTKAVLNLTISFYAASAGTNGGFYQIDNVSVRYSPGGTTTETLCDDALAPVPPGGADGATMLVNGDFSSGAIAPGWGLFGQIAAAVVGGVLEFNKAVGTPSGVILQPTGQATAVNQIFTATFQLGNTGAARRRVTVILHDLDFSDLAACTFWVAPGQPLADYAMRTFATEAWSNPTLAVYPATAAGVEGLTLMDNVTLRQTPSAAIVGTECYEPGSSVSTPGVGPAGLRKLKASASKPSAPSQPAGAAPISSGVHNDPWTAVSTDAQVRIVEHAATIDLTSASWARVSVESWLKKLGSRAEVQVSLDGQTWTTLHTLEPMDDWESTEIDLSAFLGSAIRIRVVFKSARPG